jgi:cytidylate kinase
MAPTKPVIITIDGPAGSGKSTLARGLARELGITYLSTGATYRALALKALRRGIDPEDAEKSAELARSVKIEFHPPRSENESDRVFLDGEDVTGQLDSNDVSMAASRISKHPAVRQALIRLQRDIAEKIMAERPHDGARFTGVVLEGRDTGTVVFPDADVKIFLDASLDERTRRRLADFDISQSNIENAKSQILSRDLSDKQREVSPLKPAPDAILIDNTNWKVEETLKRALEIVGKKISISGL